MPTTVKHALRALIFAGGLILLLCLLSLAFTPAEGTVDDGVHTVNDNGIIGEENNTVEVLFLGDSVVYSSVSPLQIWNEYGIPAYSCSTLAQKLWYTQDMLYKAFKTQSPKVVMLETDALFTKFSFDDSVMHKAETVVPLLKYHDRWKVLAEDIFDEHEEEASPNDYKGYKLSFLVNPSAVTNYMNQKLTEESVPSRNKSYLKEISTYCKDHGAKLILFSSPSSKNWNNARHKSVAAIAKDLGVEYIDLNTLSKELKIDWKKDTRDSGDHLNYFGAYKTTEYLGKYLNGLGIFTDRRGDEKYSSWSTAAEKYNKATAKGIKKASK